MTPESKVVSIEIAKKLKELGVRQVSEKYWRPYSDIVVDRKETYYLGNTPKPKQEDISAPDVAELGEMLRWYAQSYYANLKNEWGCAFCLEPKVCFAKTEADARGKMLVYLLENGLVTVDEVNGRVG